jgi:hypothetical protein
MKRRKEINFEANSHLIKLTQMGADVKIINSKMCYVKFDIEGFKLSYVYNINKKGKYFLERIAPYPLPIREFENEQDVINIINIDRKQFTSAIEHYEIEDYVCINKKLNETMKKFEDLFLYYRVNKEKCSDILKKINAINDEIKDIQKSSERIFFEKEPFHLETDDE